MRRPSICLAMLVRDESAIIRRCLSSALPYIDCYCVYGHESNDQTIDIVRQMLRHLPGCIERVSGGGIPALRNRLIGAASEMADYVLLLDADKTLQTINPHLITDPDFDIGLVEVSAGPASQVQPRLVRSHSSLHYAGEVTGTPEYERSDRLALLSEVRIHHYRDGYRHRHAAPIERDIELLSPVASDLPTNLLLARLYIRLNRLAEARAALEAAINSAPAGAARADEIEPAIADAGALWHCHYLYGLLSESDSEGPQTALTHFGQAFELCPDRVEPLRRIIYLKNQMGDHDAVAAFREIADEMSVPTHYEYFERPMYRRSASNESTSLESDWQHQIRNALMSRDQDAEAVAGKLRHYASVAGFEEVAELLQDIQFKRRQPFSRFDAIYCIEGLAADASMVEVDHQLDYFNIRDRVFRVACETSNDGNEYDIRQTQLSIIRRARAASLRCVLIFDETTLLRCDTALRLQSLINSADTDFGDHALILDYPAGHSDSGATDEYKLSVTEISDYGGAPHRALILPASAYDSYEAFLSQGLAQHTQEDDLNAASAGAQMVLHAVQPALAIQSASLPLCAHPIRFVLPAMFA